eukprot:g72222.t1
MAAGLHLRHSTIQEQEKFQDQEKFSGIEKNYRARAGQGRPTGEHHRKPDARNSFVHVELETLEIEQLREAAPEQVHEDGLEAEDHEKATSEVYDDDVLRGELD